MPHAPELLRFLRYLESVVLSQPFFNIPIWRTPLRFPSQNISRTVFTTYSVSWCSCLLLFFHLKWAWAWCKQLLPKTYRASDVLVGQSSFTNLYSELYCLHNRTKITFTINYSHINNPSQIILSYCTINPHFCPDSTSQISRKRPLFPFPYLTNGNPLFCNHETSFRLLFTEFTFTT